MEAFINAFPGASLAAMRQGFRDVGAEDNSIVLFSELMDSASLFLTANCDTVYFMTFLDLTGGPVVLDIPALGPPTGILGTIDDMWFRWVTDFGVSGPDRGQGGRYLIAGPGYVGRAPRSTRSQPAGTWRSIALAVCLPRAYRATQLPSYPASGATIMTSSANKTSRAHGRLIDRLRTASPTYVAMSGADVSTWASVRVSDRMWQELDYASGNYGRLSAHNLGPCPVCRMHVCLTHHSHTAAR